MDAEQPHPSMSEPIPLPAATTTPFVTTNDDPGPLPTREAMRRWPAESELHERVYGIADRALRVLVESSGGRVSVHLVTTLDAPLVLHWGLRVPGSSGWRRPPDGWLPEPSVIVGDAAAQSPFAERDGVRVLDLSLPASEIPAGASLSAVLHRPGTRHWFKDSGRDLHVPLSAPRAVEGAGTNLAQTLAARIVEEELGAGSWTLMHRFELCHELIELAGARSDALAVLFVWLRYSALRQLDWQRRYNTQPRRLTHAQDRLTRRIAELWRTRPEARRWAVRLMSTLGRGGEGQRVRDDILALMHRHHLKEVAGTFVEQWHQKLHNNTTPDDIAICDAFITFLRSNGDLSAYYATLGDYGVTRERLASYDRPITVEPRLPHADLTALAADFEGYLRLLRSVHDSTDLASSLGAVASRIDPDLLAKLRSLAHTPRPVHPTGPQPQRGQDAASPQVGAEASPERAGTIVPAGATARPRAAAEGAQELEAARRVASGVAEARQQLARVLEAAKDDGLVRDLLYLDLALLERLRGAVERVRGLSGPPSALLAVLSSTLRSLGLDEQDPELAICASHWERLAALAGEPDRDRARHMRSVVERLSRWVAGTSARFVAEVSPLAESMGRELKVADFARQAFAEEVVRGGPLFAVGSVLRQVDTALRAVAGVGSWQLVSPGAAAGVLVLTARLLDVQGTRFEEASILLAENVGGEEEIPAGVTAVVTSCEVDLLSHLAVRARNTGVLLATAWDREVLDGLRELAGRQVRLESTAAGDVAVSRATGTPTSRTSSPGRNAIALPDVNATGGVLTSERFSPDRVGGKSRVLAELRRALPDWIDVPASIALAFGTFERTLSDAGNQHVRDALARLSSGLDAEPSTALAALRGAVAELNAPSGLLDELAHAAREAGLGLEGDLGPAWDAIKRVWASKWTDRAHFARRARGVPDDGVHMAVLVQRVVEADYAFVLHTTNPLDHDPEELYGELVIGMGETLVGNFPGRAFGFVFEKRSGRSQILSYPSKSRVLRARGFIFRSDSNAEDLDGFAGAGLFESVTAAPMQQEVADYRSEPLLWDPGFQREITQLLGRVGVEVERARGAPQDVEGVVRGGRACVVQSRPQVGL